MHIQLETEAKKYKTEGDLMENSSSDHLVIFCHGLQGSFEQNPILTGMQLCSKSMNCFGFNFYGQFSGRDFSKTSIFDTVEDLKSVVLHFKQHFKKISLVGHSLAAITILSTARIIGTDIRRISLWDPSLEPKDVFLSATKIDEEKFRLSEDEKGRNTYITKKALDSWLNFDLKTEVGLVQTPIQIIVASKAGARYAKALYFDELHCEREYVVIENAEHSFSGKEAKLWEHTKFWIQK